ncbi:MAG TPA: hypothetical protein V6C81_01465 [Planktothrix sp.]|jgi:hypothetical protein
MDIFDKFEAFIGDLQGKNSLQRRLSALVNEIADCNSMVATCDSPFAKNARQHLIDADQNYKQALQNLKSGAHEDCVLYVAKAEIHAHCARANLTFGDNDVFDPAIADTSVAKSLELLSESIVRTKLAIEYSNCKVAHRIADGLKTVVALFMSAVNKLSHDRDEKARRVANGGMLLLYSLTRQLNADNDQTIIEIKLPTDGVFKEDKAIKQLADRLYECRRIFVGCGFAIPASLESHFFDSELALFGAIDAIVDNDPQAVDANIAAGMLEVDLAEKLMKNLDPSAGQPPDGETTEALPADVRSIAHRLQDQAKELKLQDATLLHKHLKAAVNFYQKAKRALDEGDNFEAERLGKAAWLDLDFAHQIVFSKKKPEYREL